MSQLKFLAYALLAIFLLFNLLHFPEFAYGNSHDLSSHAAFEYYTSKKFQFGKDVYENVGPYGFAHYASSYGGILTNQKIFIQIIHKIVLTFLILWAGFGMKHLWQRVVWFSSFILYLTIHPWDHPNYRYMNEVHPYLTSYLIALYVMQSRRDWKFIVISSLLLYFLSVLALMKHSQLALAIGALSVISASNLLRKNWSSFLRISISFLAFLIANWTIAGQKAWNFFPYINGIFQFSGGYNEAMADYEPVSVTYCGLGILLFLLIARLLTLRGFSMEKPVLALLALDAGYLFVIWKHGYVRADDTHVPIFCYFAMFLAAVICFRGSPKAAKIENRGVAAVPAPAPSITSDPAVVPLRRASFPFLQLALFLCYAFIVTFGWSAIVMMIPGPEYRVELRKDQILRNFGWIFARGKCLRQLKEELITNRARVDLPIIRAKVENQRVDLLGNTPSYLLLNDLNFSPRPMPIAFAAANPALMEKNARYYSDLEVAPEFIVVESFELNNRFPMQGDSLAIRALLYNYKPVIVEKGIPLFQRKKNLIYPSKDQLNLLDSIDVKLNNRIQLGKTSAAILWVEVEIKPSPIGRLRSFFYKPPPCFIAIEFLSNPGFATDYIFVTSIGSTGTLLNPMIINCEDLMNAYFKSPPTRKVISAFSFKVNPNDAKYFQPDIKIHIYEMLKPQG